MAADEKQKLINDPNRSIVLSHEADRKKIKKTSLNVFGGEETEKSFAYQQRIC